MKKAKQYLIVAIIIVIAILTTVFVAISRERHPNEINIGAILPLTGDAAKYGQAAEDGMQLALANIKKEYNTKINIIYEDSQGTTNGAVSAFEKLTSINKVPVIIGPMLSSEALSVAPLADKKGVVIFSPSASSPKLTNISKFFFRNWPSDTYEGGEMAKFAYDTLHLKTAAILSINLDYGVGLTDVFKKSFDSIGGKVLTTEYYNQGATDFRTQLIKIKSMHPNAVYLPGYYAEIGLILVQAKELGLKTTFLSDSGFNNPEVLKIARNAAEGVIFATPYYNPKSQTQQVKNFVDRYTKRYGKTPGIFAAQAYDALNIVAKAIKIGGYSADGIRTTLYSILDFPGVTGNTSIEKNGNVIKPIQIMVVKNGKFEHF